MVAFVVQISRASISECYLFRVLHLGLLMGRLEPLCDYVEDQKAAARGAASQHVEERRRDLERKSAGSAAASGATSQHLEEGHRDRQRQARTHSAGSRGVGRHGRNVVEKKHWKRMKSTICRGIGQKRTSRQVRFTGVLYIYVETVARKSHSKPVCGRSL